MKKVTKTIVSAAIITALFTAFQITAMAAINAASSDVVSSRVASSHVSSQAVSSHVASSEANLARSGATTSDIMPIAEGGQINPHTGAANMAIPGVVALIAAATAAITLTGKKK